MANYIIEKQTTQTAPTPEQVDSFVVKYTKTAADLDGKEVTVIDDQRQERVTVAQLEAQKVALQAQIKEIDLKLGIILKL